MLLFIHSIGRNRFIHSVGSASLRNSSSNHLFTLHNLLHVPTINKNLLSMSHFARDNGVFFEFFPNHCCVKNQVIKQIILQGRIHEGLYVFPTLHKPLRSSVNATSYNSTVHSYDLCYKLPAHASSRTVKLVMCSNNISCNVDASFCDSCARAKAHQLPFLSSNTTYIAPLQLVFVDIWGPSHVASTNGSLYYVAFVDAFSKYTWLYLISHKSQATSIFLQFKALAENQTGFSLKNLQTDNCKEFLSLTELLNTYGITHRLTCPHTH